MIIFTPIKDIPQELLEYKGVREVIKYNLSSYYVDIPLLSNISPSSEYVPESVLNGDFNSPDFDIAYHNHIMTNDAAFVQFMNIVIPVFQSADVMVQILIKQSEYRDAITESIMKLIQQRYGYNSYIVNDIEDFIYVEESTFNIPGLFTMDQDLRRFHFLMPPSSFGGEFDCE